ncbi:hypothetical protein GXB84_14605 [Stenotrophomonas acidaminiphila]|uniref:hypothetical protein n=1 Tax=Stenotrophomonas acidaminiphila TaxID=128780 RepID=UPI0013757E67|nr:hypothetical protein [Stenotrophomonas acidaminiphila]NCT88551.1 hypothetical protein [Stenotrophomonas acidaminiphila]
MNPFEVWYQKYQAWLAVRFLGMVMMISGVGMVVYWIIGLHAYIEVHSEGVAAIAEIHKTDRTEIGSDDITSAQRMCSAIYLPATGKMKLHFYPDNPARPEVGLVSDREFCQRTMQQIPNWRDHQSRYAMGWGERIGWGLLTLLVSGGGLVFLLFLAHSAGATGRIFYILVMAWYGVSVIIFFTAAYDERRPSWKSFGSYVDVQPIYITKANRVLTRPDAVYGWAVSPPRVVDDETTLDLFGQVSKKTNASGLSGRVPLGNFATDAGADVNILARQADAIDRSSDLAEELGVDLPRVDVTDSQLQVDEKLVLLEVARCGNPESGPNSTVLVRCLTPGGVSMGVVGGGSEVRTLRQLRGVNPRTSYYLVGQLSSGPRGQLFVPLY